MCMRVTVVASTFHVQCNSRLREYKMPVFLCVLAELQVVACRLKFCKSVLPPKDFFGFVE